MSKRDDEPKVRHLSIEQWRALPKTPSKPPFQWPKPPSIPTGYWFWRDAPTCAPGAGGPRLNTYQQEQIQ